MALGTLLFNMKKLLTIVVGLSLGILISTTANADLDKAIAYAEAGQRGGQRGGCSGGRYRQRRGNGRPQYAPCVRVGREPPQRRRAHAGAAGGGLGGLVARVGEFGGTTGADDPRPRPH